MILIRILTGIGIGIGIGFGSGIATALLLLWCVGCLGFGSSGVRYDSVASGVHSRIGNVQSESSFASNKNKN
jgi:hypothetical protein